METIKFYSIHGSHGYMSNFSHHSLKVLDKRYPTSEHFFQSMKFRGTKYEKEVRQAPSAMEAAKIGRNKSLPLRRDWESVKDDVMRYAVFYKFLQNEDILKQLIATGDAKIIEHTEKDKYWGDGGNGSGKNMLGQILMEVRKVLQEREAFSVTGHICDYIPACVTSSEVYQRKIKKFW